MLFNETEGRERLKRLRNWFIFLLIVLIWGSNWSVMKKGLEFVGPLNLVFHRLLFSFLALTPFLIFLREKVPRDRGTLSRLLLLGLITGLGITSTNIGLVYEKSGIGAILTYTQPLFVFCLAVPFLKEKCKPTKVLGILVGFFGVLLLSIKSGFSFSRFSYSSIILILGAFLWAVTIVYYKKFLSHVNPVVTNIFQLAVGVALLSGLIMSLDVFSFPVDDTYIFLILYMSLGSTSLAMTLWVFLLRDEEATILSTSSFIIPMVALIFGWFFLEERFELISLLGFLLIMLGVYLVNKT